MFFSAPPGPRDKAGLFMFHFRTYLEPSLTSFFAEKSPKQALCQSLYNFKIKKSFTVPMENLRWLSY